MSLNRSENAQNNVLTMVSGFAIKLIAEDRNTYSVVITDHSDNAIVSLPIDPMDNTLAGRISLDSYQQLGDHAKDVLIELARVLPEAIGAKEFIQLPVDVELDGYVRAEEHGFDRTRHSAKEAIQHDSQKILDKHPELVARLDRNLSVVEGINNISQQLQKPFHKIYSLIEENADFTESKMQEYAEEDIEGMKARLKNTNISVIALLDQHKQPRAIIRSLKMDETQAYLSDETIDQDILPLDLFKGDSEEDQKTNRQGFLLAYLMNRTVGLIAQNEFTMIAAKGRESSYEAVGLKPYPLQDAQQYMSIKLGPPGLQLNQVKTRLSQPETGLSSFGQFAADKVESEVDQQNLRPTL